MAFEADLLDDVVVVNLEHYAQLVAAERVGVERFAIRRFHRPEVMRALVVLKDLFAVEGVVHDQSPKISITRPRLSTSASMSSVEVWTAKEARVVAPRPSFFISGCVQ